MWWWVVNRFGINMVHMASTPAILIRNLKRRFNIPTSSQHWCLSRWCWIYSKVLIAACTLYNMLGFLHIYSWTSCMSISIHNLWNGWLGQLGQFHNFGQMLNTMIPNGKIIQTGNAVTWNNLLFQLCYTEMECHVRRKLHWRLYHGKASSLWKIVLILQWIIFFTSVGYSAKL